VHRAPLRLGLSLSREARRCPARVEEPIQPMHVNLRTGTVMSLAYTATGRLFAAYMPPKVVSRARYHRDGTRGDLRR
jgi:DNA-binding IclR family transcriptional regulator